MKIFDDKETVNSKPVLRWAGGKKWLIPVVNQLVRNIMVDNSLPGNYFEPFFGGGAIFFHLKSKSFIDKKAYLSDLNEELVCSYRVLKKDPETLFKELSKLTNEKEFYYEMRSQVPKSELEIATRFFYLNRTSFNGIYRVNLKNEYNVPYGNKSYKTLFERSRYFDISKLLQKTYFSKGDFSKVLKRINPGDLIFLDPPYTVAHENNGFVKYNQNIFSWEDQIRLRDLCLKVDELNGYFILTNASHESIEKLYQSCGNRILLQRPSVIGGKKAKRGVVNELLFTNIPNK